MDATQIKWDAPASDPSGIKWDGANDPNWTPKPRGAAELMAAGQQYVNPTDPTSHQAFNPAASDSFGGDLGNYGTAILGGVEGLGVGANQLAAHMNPLGLPPEIADMVSRKTDAAAKEKAELDKPLLATKAGALGDITGQTAVLGALPTSKISALGKFGNAIFGGAQQGVISALAQPVENSSSGPDISSLITGEKAPSYVGEKLKQVGTGAGFGGATAGVLSGAGLMANMLSPRNAGATISNTFNRFSNPAEREAGEDLVARTGVNLTPGEISGNKALISVENNARGSLLARNPAFAADQTKIQQWVDYANRVTDAISPDAQGRAATGEQVQGAVKTAVSNLSKIRSEAAARDYGAVNQMVQGKPAIIPQTYVQTLQSISKELAGAPQNSDSAKLASSINDLAAEGLKNADLPTLLKTRQYLSSVAGGQQRMASEALMPQQKRIASQLLGAIDTDLDNSADKLGGDVGAALKTANANYAATSAKIEGVKNGALGKLLGEDLSNGIDAGTVNKIPGDEVMTRLQKMDPTHLKTAVDLLNEHSPETLTAVKRSVLQSALDASMGAAPSEGGNIVGARPNVFVNTLAKDDMAKQRLSILFNPKEQSQINDALELARRMSDKTGTNFSGTGSNVELGALGGAVASGHLHVAAGIGGKMMISRGIAQAMANPEGLAIMSRMNKLPPGSAEFTKLSAQLAGLIGAANAGSEPSQ